MIKSKTPSAEGFRLTRPTFGPHFFQDTYAELQQVRWPTRQEALRLTAVVILASFLVGAYLGSLDLGLTQLFSLLLHR